MPFSGSQVKEVEKIVENKLNAKMVSVGWTIIKILFGGVVSIAGLYVIYILTKTPPQ